MKIEYKKNSHSKYLLRYHFVLCTKYRHELLTGVLSEDIKAILQEIADTEGYTIEIMETDKNHIHLLIEARPIFSPYSILHKIKFVSTFRIISLLFLYNRIVSCVL